MSVYLLLLETDSCSGHIDR